MSQNYSNIVAADEQGSYKALYEEYRDKYRESVPSGSIEITENGTGIDVSKYATADVNIPSQSWTCSVRLSYVDSASIISSLKVVYMNENGQLVSEYVDSGEYIDFKITQGKDTYYNTFPSGFIGFGSLSDGLNVTKKLGNDGYTSPMLLVDYNAGSLFNSIGFLRFNDEGTGTQAYITVTSKK